MTEIKDELKKLNTRMSDIDATLLQQSLVLRQHVQRTNLLDRKMNSFDKLVAEASGAIKLIKIVGGLIAVAAATVEIIRFFK